MRRIYKLSLQTNNFIKKTITITVITIAITVTFYTTTTNKNHIALYIGGKDITYRNILKRSKKSLKINLKTTFKSK